ncbi:hypothetical protein Y032_0535g3089 [Ancylostoma ceylanicum]|uniref:NAD-dependent epimerase/dehydratase domain-containing protein n=1 Tax=Ancylostoma ceylanicum TaxID=53326 RepID=A0A016WR81_9BILA|nr:hypothetical protein Y032_0535g3089 [Ancylostoma ceylanicum]
MFTSFYDFFRLISPLRRIMSSADEDKANQVVLVTGASGYVGLHCVQQLLAAGYRVRGTVRNKDNPRKVSPLLRLPHANERLELIEANLLNEEDWPRAVAGCTFILHVASPWPIVADESTIKTAVDGTLHVLRAASMEPSVKKVVLTSSCSAVNDGHSNDSRVFDETCWTDLDSPNVDNYAKSKTMAEKAAWDFWSTLDPSNRFALTVLNPTFIIGPVLSDCENGSATIVGRMMDFRTYLASPKISLGVVDVRDVARAHIEALTRPETDGERILISARSIWFKDMMKWLGKEFRKMGYLITRVEAATWVLKLYASLKIDPHVAAVMHRIGPELRFDTTKSRQLLGMTYTDLRTSLIEMMHSMIQHGMVKKTAGYEKWMAKQQKKIALAASKQSQ